MEMKDCEGWRASFSWFLKIREEIAMENELESNMIAGRCALRNSKQINGVNK